MRQYSVTLLPWCLRQQRWTWKQLGRHLLTTGRNLKMNLTVSIAFVKNWICSWRLRESCVVHSDLVWIHAVYIHTYMRCAKSNPKVYCCFPSHCLESESEILHIFSLFISRNKSVDFYIKIPSRCWKKTSKKAFATSCRLVLHRTAEGVVLQWLWQVADSIVSGGTTSTMMLQPWASLSHPLIFI